MDRRRLLLVVAAVIAVLGVLLVFVYARGAEARAAKKFDTVQVITASQELKPGESFDEAQKAGKIQLSDVAQSQELSGATADGSSFQGKVALTTIYPGEQLIPAKFGGADQVQAAATLPIPAGKLAISIAIDDDARVGTFISPGSQVAVFLTQDGVFSKVLLPRVTVLAFGQATAVPDSSSGDSSASSSDQNLKYLVTLAVSQKDAEKVRFGATIGSLSVGLLNDQSKVKPDRGVGPSNVFGRG
jgi:pilus assembly protein CpaB